MKNRQGRYTAAFMILLALVVLFLVLNVCIGSVNIPVSEIPIQILSWEFVSQGLWQQQYWEVAWHCPDTFCRLFSTIPLQVLLHLEFLPEQS